MPPGTLPLLLPATILWALGWALDVGTTVRGIHTAGGNVRLEQNPLARVVLAKLGVRAGFATLGVLEACIIAGHWVLAAHPWPWEPAWPITALCAVSIILGGLGHAMAARYNRTGRLPRALAPILRLYRWMDWAMR